MADAPTIHVADSELAGRIAESASEGHPLRVEAGGKTFILHVSRESTDEEDDDIWANYDPDKAREALRRYAGAWADLDVDKMIADLYKAREEGSRPADRPHDRFRR
ncbi:hypothetical protein BH23CHL2_BH23CHL2_36400 [soil metagenome]